MQWELSEETSTDTLQRFSSRTWGLDQGDLSENDSCAVVVAPPSDFNSQSADSVDDVIILPLVEFADDIITPLADIVDDVIVQIPDSFADQLVCW